MAGTFGQMTPKVTLAEKEPEPQPETRMNEFEQYRADKIEFMKNQLEGASVLNKELFLDMFDIILQQHKSIAWLNRMVSTMSADIATLQIMIERLSGS